MTLEQAYEIVNEHELGSGWVENGELEAAYVFIASAINERWNDGQQ